MKHGESFLLCAEIDFSRVERVSFASNRKREKRLCEREEREKEEREK